jgi:hypothetical protein
MPHSGAKMLILLNSPDQLDDLRNFGESNCNPGDGTDQRVKSFMFMFMMMMMMMMNTPENLNWFLSRPILNVFIRLLSPHACYMFCVIFVLIVLT